jgi:membrane fusion protein, adhesin transport system
MTRLDDLLEGLPAAGWRPLSWTALLLLASSAVWASQAELEEIVSATGMVVPRGQVKVVQHLEGGIITRIHVRDGDLVQAGQTLLQLDLGAGGLNREELQVRLDGLRLKRARLSAEVDDLPLALPDAESKRQPKLAAAETVAFDSRRRELDSGL